MTDRKTTIASALQRATEGKKRLTLMQGKMLAHYAEDMQKSLTELQLTAETFRIQRDNALLSLDIEKEYYQKLAREFNAINEVLCTTLHVRFEGYADDTWAIVDATTGKALTAHMSFPEALEIVLKMKLNKGEKSE